MEYDIYCLYYVSITTGCETYPNSLDIAWSKDFYRMLEM